MRFFGPVFYPLDLLLLGRLELFPLLVFLSPAFWKS